MAHIRDGGWEAEGGLRLPLRHRQQYSVSSKWHKQSQSTDTVVGYSLASHTSLIMPFPGSTGPVVYLHGLTGLRKAICESRLGYLYPCAWCAWTVQECSFNVKPLNGFQLLCQ